MDVEIDRLRLNEDGVVHGISSSEFQWSMKRFEKNLKVSIQKFEDQRNTIEFDVVNVDAPIVNAFRRILLAEVPTMAIDKVLMYNNTSLINDEVLAHRIGLVPIKADPRNFKFRSSDDNEGSFDNTIEFELKTKCMKFNPPPKDVHIWDKLCHNSKIYSSHLKFVPRGCQLKKFGQIGPVDKEILIAKLRPGQEIDLRAHCVKGRGKDHAKFSPVATATYRLLPEIKLHKEISGDDAHRLAQCFSEGVIEVVKEDDGKEVARVANPRKETCSRNVFCDEELKDHVTLGRVKNHFIFTIESTGALPADTLFLESVDILKKKCQYFLKELEKFQVKESA